MTVPKEVILDLLPVYLAGEASPATKAWLERQLSQDPELAELLLRHRSQPAEQFPVPAVPPELAVRALERTRRLMTRLRWLFGLALTFSLLPLSLEIDFNPLRVRLLLFDYPLLFGTSLLIGAGCWTAYFLLRRRLRI